MNINVPLLSLSHLSCMQSMANILKKGVQFWSNMKNRDQNDKFTINKIGCLYTDKGVQKIP